MVLNVCVISHANVVPTTHAPPVLIPTGIFNVIPFEKYAGNVYDVINV